MTDEAALLLRISAFGFACAIVYGLYTGEAFGTAGFVALGAGPGFLGLELLISGRGRIPGQTWWEAFLRFAGAPRKDVPRRIRLRHDDLGLLPTPTVGPFVIAIGIVTLILGLIYSYWVLILGFLPIAWGVWTWDRTARREQVFGRLLEEQQEREQAAQAEAAQAGAAQAGAAQAGEPAP